ncbi:hypothetical protein N7495_004339 [Penicillium taxi]|uniref:uncharacterized protein n=1 Tax=Penicillium taxi TaxID=168475 RepID=UPI0025453942|nr:uncharacterized protein N7495_004339 [Penicillium taxi]KAJ5899595.1 hypothetical protein N7495_004339 [Penicillium taxi]
MVGVPHSTGCSLCRERHIKCDEAIPECSQCQRYGRTCPGYRRTFRFQDEGPSLVRRHRSAPHRRGRGISTGSSTPTTSTAPITPTRKSSQDPIESPDNVGVAARVRTNAIALMRRHSTVALDEKTSPSLVRKSFQAAQPQFFSDFISASFPTLYFHNRFRAGKNLGFVEYISTNFGKNSYFDSATCCLSSVYLAHLTQDPTLLLKSRQMYGITLHEVINALRKPEHAMSDNMLCTAMLLSVYEMYAQSSPDAWVVHSDAVKQLMVSRGIASHNSGFGRSCWIGFRGFHIATAIYQGKPCFLDEEGWQNYAEQIMAEDSEKPGEWAAYAVISDKTFMEIAKCPRYISEARVLLSKSTAQDRDDIRNLINCIHNTSQKLHVLSAELRACISAHNQREQGIILRPGTFVGPVPEIFPETGPSLLLSGAENIISTLYEISTRLEGMLHCLALEDISQKSVSRDESNNTFTLPFRIYSELGHGPSRTSDRNDPRAVIWLDRVASSMGVLGTKVVPDETHGYVEEEDPSQAST